MPSVPGASGPILQLLSSGLELWVRQQCQSIVSLEIALQGSALGLLRGRLEGAQLLARRAVYQHLPIEQVELTSSPISVQMGNLLKGKPVQLDRPFAVEGHLGLSAEGLLNLLGEPRWRWLADALGERLFGQLPLLDVRIEPDQLVFVLQGVSPSRPIELGVIPRATGGTIELCRCDGASALTLPMDPGITIERVWITAGMLQLEGRARVSP